MRRAKRRGRINAFLRKKEQVFQRSSRHQSARTSKGKRRIPLPLKKIKTEKPPAETRKRDGGHERGNK